MYWSHVDGTLPDGGAGLPGRLLWPDWLLLGRWTFLLAFGLSGNAPSMAQATHAILDAVEELKIQWLASIQSI